MITKATVLYSAVAWGVCRRPPGFEKKLPQLAEVGHAESEVGGWTGRKRADAQVFRSAPARYDRQWKNSGMPHINYRRWSTTTSCVHTIKMYDHLCAILEQESGSCSMFATSQRCGASEKCRAAGRFWSRQTAAAACLHLPAVCGFREVPVLEQKDGSMQHVCAARKLPSCFWQIKPRWRSLVAAWKKSLAKMFGNDGFVWICVLFNLSFRAKWIWVLLKSEVSSQQVDDADLLRQRQKKAEVHGMITCIWAH